MTRAVSITRCCTARLASVLDVLRASRTSIGTRVRRATLHRVNSALISNTWIGFGARRARKRRVRRVQRVGWPAPCA